MIETDVVRQFSQSHGGNVAMIFGAAIFAIAGATGLAVDYGRAGSARANLQSALDSAVLAAARRQSSEDPHALDAVEQFVRGNFGERHRDVPVTVQTTVDAGGRVTAVASANIPMALLPIVGVSDVTISARSTAQFGAGQAEVVLVLDNTYSMVGSKIEALKTGAKELVDIIYEPADAEQTVKIGLVPFARYVNVGLGNRTQSWLSVDDDSSTPGEYCRDTYPNAVRSNCRMVPYTSYNDGIPSSGIQEICDWDYGAPEHICTPNVTNLTWNGCVGSRAHPLDTTLSHDFSTPVPGLLNNSHYNDVACPSPLTRLTNDPDAIKAEIDNMIAVGETYIPAGLTWGWRVLSPNAPFADGASRAAVPELKRFMVLMTDGANTKSPTYPHHNGSDATVANALTTEACANIKQEGTRIFAIAFDVADTSIQDLLRNCATAPPYYYVADDAAALRQAFADIAAAVVAIRLTQ